VIPEVEKALRCLYLACPAEVADDVNRVVKAALLGEPISARKPGGEPFTFSPRSAWILALNTLPPVSDHSRGFWSRLQVLTFKRRFGQAERDINLSSKLRAERAGIIEWAREGLERLQAQAAFTVVPSSTGATAEWRSAGDSVAGYVSEHVEVDGSSVVQVTGDSLYSYYRTWAERSGLKPVSSPVFKNRFAALTGAKSKAVRTGASVERRYEILHLDVGEVAGFHRRRDLKVGEVIHLPGGSMTPERHLEVLDHD